MAHSGSMACSGGAGLGSAPAAFVAAFPIVASLARSRCSTLPAATLSSPMNLESLAAACRPRASSLRHAQRLSDGLLPHVRQSIVHLTQLCLMDVFAAGELLPACCCPQAAGNQSA